LIVCFVYVALSPNNPLPPSFFCGVSTLRPLTACFSFYTPSLFGPPLAWTSPPKIFLFCTFAPTQIMNYNFFSPAFLLVFSPPPPPPNLQTSSFFFPFRQVSCLPILSRVHFTMYFCLNSPPSLMSFILSHLCPDFFSFHGYLFLMVFSPLHFSPPLYILRTPFFVPFLPFITVRDLPDDANF